MMMSMRLKLLYSLEGMGDSGRKRRKRIPLKRLKEVELAVALPYNLRRRNIRHIGRPARILEEEEE